MAFKFGKKFNPPGYDRDATGRVKASKFRGHSKLSLSRVISKLDEIGFTQRRNLGGVLDSGVGEMETAIMEGYRRNSGDPQFKDPNAPVDPNAPPPPTDSMLIDADTAALRHANSFTAEIFTRLYEGDQGVDVIPQAERGEIVPWVDEAHEILGEMQEFKALQESVAADPDMSAIAAGEIAAAMAPQMVNLVKLNQSAEQKDRAKKVLAAVAKQSSVKAIQQVSSVKGQLACMMPGKEYNGAGSAEGQDTSARFKLAQQLVNNKDIQKIMDLAGRLLRNRDGVARKTNGYSEVVDTEVGSAIARMLPSEALMLVRPGLKPIFKKRFTESALQQYRMEAHEPEARGPVVVILDESGSMCGNGNMWARAVGLACISRAMKENRPVTVVGFTTHVTSVVHISKSKVGYIGGPKTRTSKNEAGDDIEFIDEKISLEKKVTPAEVILFVLEQNASGGTDFGPVMDVAMHHLPNTILEKKADFIFVTDGAAEIDDGVLNELRSARENGLKVFGMTVNGGSASEAVKNICDRVIDIDKMENAEEMVAAAIQA